MSTQGPDVRQRRRVQFGLVVIPCVVGAVIGGSFAMADSAKSSHHHHSVGSAVLIAAVVAGLAATVALLLLRQLNRSPAIQRLYGTDMAQRRSTARAVQKREPLTAEQRGTAEVQLEHLVSAARRLT
jgi:phosphate/sulfate permease